MLFFYTSLGTHNWSYTFNSIPFRVVSILVEINKTLNICQNIHIFSSAQKKGGLNSAGDGIFFNKIYRIFGSLDEIKLIYF